MGILRRPERVIRYARYRPPVFCLEAVWHDYNGPLMELAIGCRHVRDDETLPDDLRVDYRWDMRLSWGQIWFRRLEPFRLIFSWNNPLVWRRCAVAVGPTSAVVLRPRRERKAHGSA